MGGLEHRSWCRAVAPILERIRRLVDRVVQPRRWDAGGNNHAAPRVCGRGGREVQGPKDANSLHFKTRGLLEWQNVSSRGTEGVEVRTDEVERHSLCAAEERKDLLRMEYSLDDVSKQGRSLPTMTPRHPNYYVIM